MLCWMNNVSMKHELSNCNEMSRKCSRCQSKEYSVNRNSATKIAQLRTGHCGLNRYLHRFGIKNTPYCQCGYGKETVEHYLLECRKYREERKKFRREVGAKKMRVARLLGDTKLIKHTLEYINATGRLKP